MINNHKSCLILNGDYSPIGVINWQKSIVWEYKYSHKNKPAISIIEYYIDDGVMSSTGRNKLPAVIKLNKYFKPCKDYVNFSRKNLFIRDNYTCQYCGSTPAISQLTYDHVIPKSQWKKSGSPTSWTNIVTACRKCNRHKANRTPEQANMPLKNNPHIPTRSPKYLHIHSHLLTIKNNIPEPWLLYIV